MYRFPDASPPNWEPISSLLKRSSAGMPNVMIGASIGFAGLSLRADHPRRFVVDGRAFTTWCAWDTLSLPALLQSNAVVESPDPETGPNHPPRRFSGTNHVGAA